MRGGPFLAIISWPVSICGVCPLAVLEEILKLACANEMNFVVIDTGGVQLVGAKELAVA